MRYLGLVDHARAWTGRSLRQLQESRPVTGLLALFSDWRSRRYSDLTALVLGTVLVTLLVLLFNRLFLPLPSPGVAYLPLIAMLAYYWRWQLVLIAVLAQLLCVYFLFLPPALQLKPLAPQMIAQLLVLILVSVFILALVELARNRRDAAEKEAGRFAALNSVGTALASEHDRGELLELIAHTACDLTGAGFAAFTLRPIDSAGEPVVPSEGNLFHLAAVVGVTREQERLFQSVPLGGEGLLAPIFRFGVAVRIADVLAQLPPVEHTGSGGERESSYPADEMIPAESRRDRARRLAHAYAQGEIASGDLQAVGVPRGHPVVRSFLGVPLFDRDRRVRGGLLLGHDEPDHFTQADTTLLQALAAQAEVALENTRLYQAAQEQAQELTTVFESIADAVIVYDLQGNVKSENPAGALIRERLARQDPESGDTTSGEAALLTLLGQSSGQVSPENRVNIDSPTVNMPISLQDEHGERREYLVSGSRLRTEGTPDSGTGDGDVSQVHPEHMPDAPYQANGTVVVWHEVTEARKLLTEQQARSEAEAQRTLLQMVIDELPSGVFLVRGTDARLVLANRAAQAVLGAEWRVGEPLTAFLTRSGVQVAGVNGQTLGVGQLASMQAITTGTPVRHQQEIIRRPDGTSLPILTNAVALDWLLLRGLPLPDEPAMTSGDPVALVVFQDVTALKEAEQLKDEFIAIAAHELKTPMAAVKGYADMLLRQSQKDQHLSLAAWQKEALETIDQATNRLVELTDDLLDVARLQADHMQLHPEPHDLLALARRVMKRFQVVGANHTISLATQDEFVVAELDIRRTEQVVSNLLSNAIKYSPSGGDITISVYRRQEAGMAELAVKDQGIGIPAAQHALLFNRFARASNAREMGITGTGLGLYLCRELIERQGGHLWFTSEEGKGSIFTFRLPLAAPVTGDVSG